eukprot:COSAG02_NODE_22171_length_761_cov_1.151057_2_plen_62_part_00
MTVIGDLENEEVRSGAIKDPTGIPASPFGSVRIQVFNYSLSEFDRGSKLPHPDLRRARWKK